MSLRLITGRTGTGKTTYVQQEIAEMMEQDPMGDPIFLIVPDQMSYSAEYSLSSHYGVKGLIRSQVATFKRLAWRVLQETGGITRKEVNGFGYRMLIRSVLEEHQEEFKMFRKAAGKRGFTDQIEELLKEFSRYCLDCEKIPDLHQKLMVSNAPRTLIDKTDDLSILMNALDARLGTSYVDSEGYLALLVSQIKHSDLIKSSHVYIDGFVTFTTRELEIVAELMKYAKRVTVVLPMDEEYSQDNARLFFNPVRTGERIMEIAQQESVEIEEPLYMDSPLRFHNEDLSHLETEFDNHPAVAKENEGNVQIIEAANRHAEVHALARRIRELMRDGMRYREMAILYRQPEVYDELIETVFPQYEIPVFISRKKPMLHHPLIEFSRSVLEAVMTGWKYEPIFRAVKTDLFFPHGADKKLWRERADRLENYVISQGIYGDRWFDEKRWVFKRYRGLEFHTTVQTDEELYIQKELHEVRDFIRNPLMDLEARLKRCRTGRDVAEALFSFMEDLHIYDKMVDLRTEEEKEDKLLAATEHDQAWNQWIEVLDQFVLMFGETEMPLEQFAKILDEGFDTLEFARIPPSMDQVTVTTIDISRVMNMKAVFVIGVNDGVLPRRIDQEGLLSDSERELFMQIGLELAPTSKMRLMDETFMAYRAFTTPQEKLIVTYPVADEEGKALMPSLYINRLQQLLPGTDIQLAAIDPTELPEDNQMDYISHPRPTLPFVAMQIRQAEVEGELSPEWRAVLAYYEDDPYWSSVVERVIFPLRDQRATEKLYPELTKELYGESFTSSVSRVESYYSCPFQHFASYGLQLQERPHYELEAPAIGDLFHAALKWVSDETLQSGKSWSQLSKEECWSLARNAVDQIAPYFFNQILLSTNRYVYIKRKLQQIVQRTLYSLSQHSKVSGFVPVAVEAGFGPGEQLPPLQIPLKRGESMKLRGRIDRVDATRVNGKPYVRIVDYKSSSRALDLNEVYYGLSLQMLTYLDVALDNSKVWLDEEASPAGVLYVHIHNPMLKPNEELTDSRMESELLRSFKMKGYVLDDPEVVTEMDQDMEGFSSIIPVRMNKDQTLSKSQSKILSGDDMQLMRLFVRKKHQQAGNEMLEGNADVLPYRMKDKMPCQFCSYRSVCQFDPTDPASKYRPLHEQKPEEMIEKIRKEVQPDDHSN
ncbi:helicase-exonuclease AddAB subunit AddB [Chungangia koreensis]|uniref:ATP-dependent helicase/deoxyribonuclease subunit B n=1 Tax=Chungangia koreensis TaxID=752657 RepID=A0ABV8X5J6_9LACT